MFRQLLFRECWSEKPLEWRQWSDPGQKLMRNRGAGEPEVETEEGAEEQEVDGLNYVDCEGRAALFSICED